jgi:hypothetical protein
MDRYHLLSKTGKVIIAVEKYENQIRNKLQLFGIRICSGEYFAIQQR